MFQNVVKDYTGVDIAENLVNYYHKQFIVVSNALLPFSNDSFDAIFTYAVHEHIPELMTALEEIIRVVRPGGVVLFAPAWHTRPWFAEGYAVRSYSDLSWKGKLVKFSIPFRDCLIVRWPYVFLRRLFHLFLYCFSPKNIPLRYKKLHANYEKYWQSDSDACNSLDPFDLILWFRSRGFSIAGGGGLVHMLFFRGHALELEKAVNSFNSIKDAQSDPIRLHGNDLND